MKKWHVKSRKGSSLIEVVFAIGLLAIIVSIALALLTISTKNVKNQNSSSAYQRGVDDFVYGLLLEMKSAESIAVSGDEDFPVLHVMMQDSSVITYEVNNLRGTIFRNREETASPLVEGVVKCFFQEEDEGSFTITIFLTEEESIEYTMRCG